MSREIVCITQAELRGLQYGQDIITRISTRLDTVDRFAESSVGFIDGLIENIQNGLPVTEEKLLRLRDGYLQMLRTNIVDLKLDAQTVWRLMQDEENKDRHTAEVERGVNS